MKTNKLNEGGGAFTAFMAVLGIILLALAIIDFYDLASFVIAGP